MKPNTHTLLEVTGERPICFYCKKKLKPDTFWVEVDGRLDSIPSIEEIYVSPGFGHLAVQFGYRPERVYRLVYGKSWDGKPNTRLHYWRGTYDGRGIGHDYPWPLFCGLEHAAKFATACWNAGIRMKEK